MISQDDTPRPKRHLVEIARKYPQVWKQVDELRAARGRDLPDWPEWCFLPVAGTYTIVSSGGVLNSPKEAADVGILAALAA